MNDRSDIERVLAYWLEDGPATMPDRVMNVVARRINVRPQQRSGRLLRRSVVGPIRKWGIAAAAVVGIAIAGYGLLPRNGSIGGPSPTATPIATATPVEATMKPFACDEPASACAGPLTAGPITSASFEPVLTFTVPNGWVNSLDTTRAYTLHDNFTRGHFLQVLSQVAIPEQNADCSPAPKADAGNTVADWVAFLTTNPGLVVTAPRAIKLGGYDGVQLDLHVASSWTKTCPNSLGPAVVLLSQVGAQPGALHWIDDQQVTMRIIDVAGETVIIYLESSPSPSDLAALNDTFAPIFNSFKFTPAS